MGTKFPSFSPKTSNPLWFNTEELIIDEAELSYLEKKYAKWIRSAVEKDKDYYFIGKKAETTTSTEAEVEGESDESESDEAGDQYHDSPEEQIPTNQVDTSVDDAGNTDARWNV
uniref:Uncharacterized protein n=1 Tax=Ciona savignyi TaxID=51511 RepID=H2ZI57_CIOSA